MKAKRKKDGLTACGVKPKPAHKSWGEFQYCPKCKEIVEICAKSAKRKG